MPRIPTIKEIREDLSNNLKDKLEISDDNLRKKLDAFSAVISAQMKLLYLSLSDVQDNLFVDKADTFENGGTLDRFGQIYLNRTRKAATNGEYEVSVDAEAGTVLRQGLTFKSNDDSSNPGNLYILDSELTLTGSNDTITIRSLDSGTAVFLLVGDTLTITEPVIGVISQIVEVVSEVSQPLAEESVEDYRTAILESIQLEPQGGSRTDYRLWASDAQGVRKVYPYVKDGDGGTVQVYVEATLTDSTDGKGTPSTTILDNVEEVINFDPDETKPINERGRIPIQANLEVLSINLIPVDVTITGLSDSSTSVFDSVKSNLDSYLYNIRPYVAGADLSRNKNDILFAARLQSAVTDVLDSSNFFTNFVVQVNGVEQNSFEFTRADMPYLRNLNFN